MTNDIVRGSELGPEFDIGNIQTDKVRVKLGQGLANDVDGSISVLPRRPIEFTHWRRTLGANWNVANNSNANIFENFVAGDKLAISATGAGALDFTTAPSGQAVIKVPYAGVSERLSIRLALELTQGGTDFYRYQLKRAVDNSVVTTYQISINSNDIADDIVTTEISTYVGGPTDPFVVDGFYIDFRNTSGGVVRIHDFVDVLVTRQYTRTLVV